MHWSKYSKWSLLFLSEILKPLPAQLDCCVFVCVCFSRRNAAWPFTSQTALRRAALTAGLESRSPIAVPAPPSLCPWASLRKSTTNRPHRTAALRVTATLTPSPVSTDRCPLPAHFQQLSGQKAEDTTVTASMWPRLINCWAMFLYHIYTGLFILYLWTHSAGCLWPLCCIFLSIFDLHTTV